MKQKFLPLVSTIRIVLQEIQSNLQKINWSPHETFSYEIVNSTTQEDKEYKLKCIMCSSVHAGPVLLHNRNFRDEE